MRANLLNDSKVRTEASKIEGLENDPKKQKGGKHGNKNGRTNQLLSSPQDKRQNDKSGFCGVSSPSPRDEGVGRGEAL